MLAAVLLTSSIAPAFQEPAQPDSPFPPSSVIAEGLSPEALAKLDGLVQSFVDDDEIVGAELLVIKNGRSVLHQGYGLRDREAGTPMEPGGVFCVRSMTKPVVGTVALMLVDDKVLSLTDRVAKYLPSFDVDGQRDITVEHLLTHTSGLPMSLLLGKNLRELDGIQAVAQLGAAYELDFEPGTQLTYSDQGTDTLTALIEVASGVSAAELVRTRVLEPLGMTETACVMTEGHALRERGCHKYVGTRGRWTELWAPDKPPLFPFFLGSQGLYSTLEDYARFLQFWLKKGYASGGRLLSRRGVRKALTPSPFPLNQSASGFPDLRSDYGFLMQLWTAAGEERDDGRESKREVTVFGHTGSDGTHAWAFPDEDAMVLYFTQSRGNTTGLRVEEALGELFLGVPYDPNQAAPPLEQYLGYYWEGAGDLYRAIVIDNDGLALEILGKGVVALTYAGEDRWKLPDPSLVIDFDRDADGEVSGYHIGDHQEFRFDPSPDLPDVNELAQLAAETHQIDLLETLGPMRFSGRLTIASLGVSGTTMSLLAWPDRFREEALVRDEYEHTVFDGSQVLYASKNNAPAVIEGERAENIRLDSSFARFGDLRDWHPSLEVIQRLERVGADSGNPESVYLVRAGDATAPARTIYIHAESGRVIREDGMVFADVLGRIGRRLSFGDFREVEGMLLPYRTEVELAASMVGTIVAEIDEVELGVELTADAFSLSE